MTIHQSKNQMDNYFGSVSEQDVEQLAAMFRLLTDKTRLTILFLLAQGERNVSSLCDELKLPQPTVSHHLGLLRMGNAIVNRRAGKQVFYGLNDRIGSAKSSLTIAVQNYNVQINRNTLSVIPELQAG